MKRTRAGFTLLELMIVVGIIAVLAAIAVPHMLEAQTRSKVAAAKSNIRVLVDAVDMYRVDQNRFPYVGSVLRSDPLGLLSDVQLSHLTTPIAYVSPSAFADPFGQIKLTSINSAGLWSDGSNVRNDFPVPTIPNPRRSTLYYYYPAFATMTGNPLVNRSAVAVISIGPDRTDSFGVFRPFTSEAMSPLARAAGFHEPVDTQYDPTNGVVSSGDVGGFTGSVPVNRIP